MKSNRIPSLDGVRAISIALVLLDHLNKSGHIQAKIAGSYGTTGVHIFFVLSGYLITSLLLQEHDRDSTVGLGRFYVRRAFRIFPAAFAFLAVSALLFRGQVGWYHLLGAVFYAANMEVSRPWIFGHLWSLAIEEQFDVLWPFAVENWFEHR